MTAPIERVMVAPLNYSHVQWGQISAFDKVFESGDAGKVWAFDFMAMTRAGHVLDYINRDFTERAIHLKPDWIWLQVQGANVIQPWAIERIKQALPKCLITHWMGDCRLTIPPDLAAMCAITHATLLSNVGQLGVYRRAGAPRAHYVQIGLDWEEDVLGLPEWTPPFNVPAVVFCGGFYGRTFDQGSNERISAIRALVRAGIDVGVVGTGWPSDIPVIGACHVKQQHHVYKRAKVALSINHFNDIERYYSDRQLIAMASGTPVVCRYVPGLEDEFVHGSHCLFWRDETQLVQHVRWLLADDARAARVGELGRDQVIEHHTWEARIRQLLPFAEQWRGEL